MASTRTLLGSAASAAWLAAAAYFLLRDPAATAKMTPNEWGDFFAGTSAPLAFLWLVLGYLQQGEELRLSTEALKLQAEELRNSVEQQRALVEVSRLQVESEREALEYERRLRDENSKPIFEVIGAGGAFQGSGACTYRMKVRNVGHDATAVRVDFVHESGERLRLLDGPILSRGGEYEVNIPSPRPLETASSRIHLAFTDGLGRKETWVYAVERESADPRSTLKASRVEA